MFCYRYLIKPIVLASLSYLLVGYIRPANSNAYFIAVLIGLLILWDLVAYSIKKNNGKKISQKEI